MNVEEEVEKLKEEIKRLGKVQDDGSYKVTFLNPSERLYICISRFAFANSPIFYALYFFCF